MCSRDNIVLCLGQRRIQLRADTGTTALTLLVATTLSVYKPRSLTSYRRRKQRAVP
jgi:hypothetical protein